MIVTADNARFDQLQQHVLNEIVASIRDGLRDAGIDDPHVVREAIGAIAMSIASIVDGSRMMSLEDTEVIPVLTFAREREGKELIGSDAGGSWMHEYVYSVVDSLPEDDDDDELDESIDFIDDDEGR